MILGLLRYIEYMYSSPEQVLLPQKEFGGTKKTDDLRVGHSCSCGLVQQAMPQLLEQALGGESSGRVLSCSSV